MALKTNDSRYRVRLGLSKAWMYLVLGLFSVTCVFPFVWLAYSSLKTNKQFVQNIISLPAQPTLSNYVSMFKTGNMGVYFINSLIVAVASTAVVILIGFMVSYALARYRFRSRNLIYVLFICGMLIPIHSLLLPTYLEMNTLRLLGHRWTLILVYAALGLPMAIFLMESFIQSLPREMEEAAFIDGAGPMRAMFSIILPMTKPALATALIYTFIILWNEFPFALVLSESSKLYTIPVGLTYFTGNNAANYPGMMAALVVAILPLLIIYAFFYRNIMESMVAGAVKG